MTTTDREVETQVPPKLPFLFRNAVFCVDEGDVTIRWPGELSVESVAYIEEYFAIMLGGMKRRALASQERDKA